MRRKNAGIALLTALGMLVVFSILGSAYVTYMVLEKQKVDYDLGAVRARTAAEAGIRQAIGAVGAALSAGAIVPDKPETAVALYKPAKDGALGLDGARSIEIAVSVSDEASRINVNLAPTRVLAAILGVDPNTARDIRMHLPRLDSDDPSAITMKGARWLASVDELMTLAFVSPEKVNPDLLTVHTGETGTNAGWLNVNSASPEALAAVLDVPVDQAQRIKEAGPFTSLDQLAAAAGKDPATFSVRPPVDAPGTLPKELSFTSRCYRIVSHANLVENGVPKAGSSIEAVVYFNPDGRPEIRYWNEAGGINKPTEAAANAA